MMRLCINTHSVCREEAALTKQTTGVTINKKVPIVKRWGSLGWLRTQCQGDEVSQHANESRWILLHGEVSTIEVQTGTGKQASKVQTFCRRGHAVLAAPHNHAWEAADLLAEGGHIELFGGCRGELAVGQQGFVPVPDVEGRLVQPLDRGGEVLGIGPEDRKMRSAVTRRGDFGAFVEIPHI